MNEQYKSCETCGEDIHVGQVYISSANRNSFGGEIRHYWHWDCIQGEITEFLERVKHELLEMPARY